MSEHDDDLYLSHIADAIGRISRSVGGDRDRFFQNVDIQDATLRRLHTIAESTQHLSEEPKERHPSIPWNDIRAFRNRIVHGYLDVDESSLETVERDLRPLAEAVGREMIRGQEQSQSPDHRKGLDHGL